MTYLEKAKHFQNLQMEGKTIEHHLKFLEIAKYLKNAVLKQHLIQTSKVSYNTPNQF